MKRKSFYYNYTDDDYSAREVVSFYKPLVFIASIIVIIYVIISFF